jgi:hypothetical protein
VGSGKEIDLSPSSQSTIMSSLSIIRSRSSNTNKLQAITNTTIPTTAAAPSLSHSQLSMSGARLAKMSSHSILALVIGTLAIIMQFADTVMAQTSTGGSSSSVSTITNVQELTVGFLLLRLVVSVGLVSAISAHLDVEDSHSRLTLGHCWIELNRLDA